MTTPNVLEAVVVILSIGGELDGLTEALRELSPTELNLFYQRIEQIRWTAARVVIERGVVFR